SRSRTAAVVFELSYRQVRSALRGHARHCRLEEKPGLIELVDVDLSQLQRRLQRSQRRAESVVSDEAASAVSLPNLHPSLLLEDTHGLTNASPAHLELLRDGLLGREPVARLTPPTEDVGTKLLDNRVERARFFSCHCAGWSTLPIPRCPPNRHRPRSGDSA